MAIPSIAMIPSGYKASKLYSVLPTDGSGDLTVVRATTATRVNSSGVIEEVLENVPRLDYTGGGCPSLLVEPQRTNLLPYSEDFTNIIWTKARTTAVLESVLNPKNTLTTYYLQEDDTTNSHELFQAGKTITAGSILTSSIYFKRKIGSADRFLRVQMLDDTFTNGARVLFNIQTGTIAVSPLAVGLGSNVSAKIEDYGNGWYRGSLTCKLDDVSTTVRANNYLQSSGVGFTATYTGDGVSGAYLFGAQLEQGAYSTSYIPTVASTVTRVKDVISRTDLYTNGLVTNSGGTWFVELINNKDLIRDASSNMFLGTSSSGNDTALVIRSGSATSAKLSISTRISGTITAAELITTETAKVLVKWNGVTCDFFINGTKYDAGTSFPFIELNFLTIEGVDVPKYIKQMQIFPTPLTDLECETLTTL
jgi:hypothetical protein